MKIRGQAFGTEAQIASYSGSIEAPGQMVWSTDGKRMYVMDGETQGGYKIVMSGDLLNYLTKTDAQSLYLGINAKAQSASTADTATSATTANTAASATKATQDAQGRDIPSTYATKSELTSGLDGKANSNHSHSYVPLSGGTVSGNLTVKGTLKGGTVQATSDYRLKRNIKPIVDIDISNVKAYRYSLLSDPGRTHVGLIAQEVQEVLPEAISQDADGYLALDYNAVIAVLLNKVNDLEKRLQQLEG